MNDYVVYKHTNKLNGLVYIGITNNVKRRWRNNGIEYKPDRKNSSRFWNAISKYGWDNFKHEILYKDLTFKQACKLEKENISKYNSQDKEIGYNIASGGNGGKIYKVHPRGMLNHHQTEHQIESHREWASVKENNCMTNGTVIWGVTREHPKGMLGHTQTDKQKQAMKDKNSGLNNVNHKSVTVIKPDGSREHFNTASACVNHFNFYRIWNLLKIGKPYKLPTNNIPNRAKCEKLDGYLFIYDKNLEDTEVSH